MNEEADRCIRCNHLNFTAIQTEFAHYYWQCSTEIGHIKPPKIELQGVGVHEEQSSTCRIRELKPMV